MLHKKATSSHTEKQQQNDKSKQTRQERKIQTRQKGQQQRNTNIKKGITPTPKDNKGPQRDNK